MKLTIILFKCFIFEMDVYLDLKAVNLSKAEFVKILMNNQIFSALSDFFNERKEEDEDFFV